MTIIAPIALTAVPTPPDPNDRTTFNTRAYPWAVAQQALGADVTREAASMYSNALDAYGSAVTASGAAAAAGATVWVSGTSYAIGNARFSPIDGQTYRRITAAAGSVDPSADSANWVRINLTAIGARIVRTTDIAINVNDYGKLIDISTMLTQSIAPAVSLGPGWF